VEENSVSRLDDLFAALGELDAAAEGSKATSVRLPEALHRAAQLATEMGMDESFTAATSRALTERIVAFARREALAQHFSRLPADRPPLAAVAHRRARGTDHPVVHHPELVDDVAAWVEHKVPDWAASGAVDATVDLVLGYVEMLAARVGVDRRTSA
jgi:hypothetical protein